jgi:hypothetical protein
MTSTKAELVASILAELARQKRRLEHAAREAHAAATDPDAKAESKYDTRSLEASYLAAGQAQQVESLAEAIRLFETTRFPDFEIDDPVGPGALVELTDDDGHPAWYLLAPAAGGMELEFEGAELTVLTPDTQLYSELIGKTTGDILASPEATITEVR